MSEYSILFLGDIVGRPGRKVVLDNLKEIQNNPDRYVADRQDFRAAPLRFTIVNGENAAGGTGITSDIADELFKVGVDAITLGNHWARKQEVYNYLNSGRPIVRPANVTPGVPGRGVATIERGGTKLAVMNLCGRTYMDFFEDPFLKVNQLLEEIDTPHIFVDFHGEATSEKLAFGYHLAGRATAVVGTHTHVPTADEQVLPDGTAYITDVGMCGPKNSILGTDRHVIIERFKNGLPAKFEVANEPGVISGVVINVQVNTGRATAIKRIVAS